MRFKLTLNDERELVKEKLKNLAQFNEYMQWQAAFDIYQDLVLFFYPHRTSEFPLYIKEIRELSKTYSWKNIGLTTTKNANKLLLILALPSLLLTHTFLRLSEPTQIHVTHHTNSTTQPLTIMTAKSSFSEAHHMTQNKNLQNQNKRFATISTIPQKSVHTQTANINTSVQHVAAKSTQSTNAKQKATVPDSRPTSNKQKNPSL
jgi:hypothetical protein